MDGSTRSTVESFCIDEVSVIIPAYNPGPFLREALDSLLGQTYTLWSAVVIDDGSSEDLSYVRAVDPRVLLLRQDNAGVSAARNAGIRATSAQLIAFLDADDLWLPRKLEQQVAALAAHEDAVLCSTDFEIVDADSTQPRTGYGGSFSYIDLLEGCGIGTSTVMIRRGALDSVGLFDVRYRQAQDWDLWLRLAQAQPLTHCHEVLARYRIHASNASRNYERLLDEGRMILQTHRATDDQDVRAAAERGIRNLHRLAGAQAYDRFREQGHPIDLVRALRLAPQTTSSQMRRFLAKRLRAR